MGHNTKKNSHWGNKGAANRNTKQFGNQLALLRQQADDSKNVILGLLKAVFIGNMAD